MSYGSGGSEEGASGAAVGLAPLGTEVGGGGGLGGGTGTGERQTSGLEPPIRRSIRSHPASVVASAVAISSSRRARIARRSALTSLDRD